MMRTATSALVVLFTLFVQTATASEPYAPTPLTPAAIFELNRHATGSRQPGSYHVVKQTTSQDGDVWTMETYSSGWNFRTTVRQAGFTWSYGSYDGKPWNQDSNGLVVGSSTVPLVDPFATSLRSPQDPSSGVKVLGVTSDASPSLVVEVTPRDGLVERRFYNARNHLLDRIEMVDYDGHQQIWRYEDYRPEYGLTIAHAVDYERDGTSVTERSQIVKYERSSGEVPDLTPPPSRLLFDLANRESVEIPAQFRDEGIIVPVTIGGRTMDFALDSGSSDLVIDAGVARELGLQTSGAQRMSFAGDFTMANVRAPSLTVGGLTATNVAFSTAPFQEQLEGSRLVGLLGGDFIASGALEVNFAKKTLTLFKTLPQGLAAQGWSALPLRLSGRVPMLKATFSGKEGTFIADLGATYSTLYPHFFAQFPNRIPRDLRDEEEMVTVGGKPFGVTHITMRSMILGDWVFGNVQVVVPSASYAQERDYDGLIGREVLSSFNLIFDYAGQQLWFKPI